MGYDKVMSASKCSDVARLAASLDGDEGQASSSTRVS